MAAIMMASAMSYSQAREQAWFLTDKMAYELYLTYAQVDAVYEINLDYIMNVDVMGDIFGIYWERRTKELSYVLTYSQMHTFLATEYFYRPITWVSNTFHFTIYDRYPRTTFYRSAPVIYTTYRGENRHSTGKSRFEGKFENVKPVTTGRTLSTRTGTSGNTNNGGFTNPGNGTVTNGRTRPSGSTVTTTTTRSGAGKTNTGATINSSTRTGAGSANSGTKVTTTTTRTEPRVTSTATMGSVRSGSAIVTRTESTSKVNRTVTATNSSNSGTVKSGTVNNNRRTH